MENDDLITDKMELNKVPENCKGKMTIRCKDIVIFFHFTERDTIKTVQDVMYDKFGFEFSPMGSMRLKYLSSASLLEQWEPIFGTMGSKPIVEVVITLLGGGPHQKMKKTHKLAILKSKCSNASAKASCDALAGDLLVQASQVYQEMMNDESGDYINRCLRKMSIAQLEELLGKMNTMVLTEKSFVRLVEYIIPIYKDIAMTATKVDTASKALEEAFQYQMAFSFYNDAKGKFTFTLPDIVATIIATKKDGNDMAL